MDPEFLSEAQKVSKRSCAGVRRRTEHGRGRGRTAAQRTQLIAVHMFRDGACLSLMPGVTI